MNPSYSTSAFTLQLPVVTASDDNLTISFRFNGKTEKPEHIAFYRATFVDKVKVTYQSKGGEKLFPVGKKGVPALARIETKKKAWVNGASLTLEFLSDSGEKTTVLFLLSSSSPTHLMDVSKTTMSAGEKSDYVAIFKNATSSSFGEKVNEKKAETQSSSSTSSSIPGLKKYQDALKTEKLFLMQGGGKKYKVTHGRLLAKSTNAYSYLFDLEAELYIADDAPIKISTGMESASGTVLMCEDFQIIVQLETGLGDQVASAVISVEPWKLLEALEDRLEHTININASKMANTLVNEGPSLATKLPVDKIPKGQDQVIAKAMSEPVTIVWGPPGTGKTHTMSELAIRFIEKGYSVLIVSHSNVSVDGVAKKIDELLRQKGKTSVLKAGTVLRYGYVRDEALNRNPYVNSFYYAVTKNEALNKKLDLLQDEYDQLKKTKGLTDPKIITLKKEIGKIRAQIREQEQFYVSKAKVVATTISKVVIDKMFQDRKFDVVMFDEVSMAYVLQVVAAATFATKHMICVGDFMQLAPIAQSSAQDILCQDIFTHLGINHNGQPYFHPWLVMLDEQRRMEPRISAFANQYVYKGLLKNHPSTHTSRAKIVASNMFPNEAINLVDLTASYCAASKNSDNSRYNILSALLSFCMAIKSEKSVDVENVSVITPYAAQTRLIRALILDYRKSEKTEIRCATVHQFQGSESDVIVFDAVESYPSKKPGWLMGKDFNSILRLINVAVTRARGKLITVANATFWDNNYNGTSHTFFRLVKYLNEKGHVVRYEKEHSLLDLIGALSLKGGPQFYTLPEQYMDVLKKDIQKAHGKIVVSLPSGKLDPATEKQICSWLETEKQNGVRVLIKCNDYQSLPNHWKMYSWGTENATFPIIMIDDRITLFGAPTSPWQFNDGNKGYITVCHAVCRVNGEHTAEMIRSLSDLEYREVNGNKSLLLPKPEAIGDAEGPSGLAAYVAKNKICPNCKKAFVLTKGKSGKTILWCKECKSTQLLSPEDINHYMMVNHVKCPQHHCDMEAKIGKYGLYIRCDAGHYLKPEEI